MGFESLDWISQVSQNTAINLRVPYKENNFLIRWDTVSFLREILPNEWSANYITMANIWMTEKINWKGCGKKLSWPILSAYPTDILTQGSLSPDRGSIEFSLAVLMMSVSVPQPQGTAMQHAEHQPLVGDVPETKQQRATPHRKGTPCCRGTPAETTSGHGQQASYHQESQDGAWEARHHRVSSYAIPGGLMCHRSSNPSAGVLRLCNTVNP